MKLENQVVSLELAKELKALGMYKPSVYAYYGNAGIWHGSLVETCYYGKVAEEVKKAKLLPAYTVAELGEMLPIGQFAIYHVKTGWLCTYKETLNSTPVDVFGDSQANCYARMLIHLIKNKLI